MEPSLTPDLSNRRHTWIGIGFVILFYAALACLLTWPLAAHLSTHLLGRSDDTPLHYWNCWWVGQALHSDGDAWFTPYLFYPNGASLVTHNIAWANAILWVATEPFVGGIAAYNLALLLNLMACGCATYWLAYRLTGDRRAALLAGVIDQAWPYRLSQLGHPNLLSTYWIPIFLLFLLQTIERRRWRDAALCGVAFAFVGYTRWQQLIAAAPLGLALLAFCAPQWLKHSPKQAIGRLFVVAAISAALLAPAAWMLYQQQTNELSAATLVRQEESVMQTDLLAYITPWSDNPIVGGRTQHLYDRYYHDREGRRTPAYLGAVALALATIGVIRKRRAATPWLVMALGLVALALGPVLRINGKLYENVPMVYRALEPLTVFRLMREPDRYNVFLGLPISVLAAYGIRSFRPSKFDATALRGYGVTGLLSALIVSEYLMAPLPLSRVANPPSFFAEMATEAENYAVVNLPFDPLKSKIYMFDQTNHHHPILEGHISRVPANAYQYIDSNPWLSKLRQTQEMAPSFPDVSQQLGALAQDGVRYIILHKNLVGADRVSHWKRYLAYAPRYEDERLAIYSTEPQAGKDFAINIQVLPGVGPIKTVTSADCLMPGQPLELDVAWGTSSELERDYDLLLSLVNEANMVQQYKRYPLVNGWPTHLWSDNSIAWGYYVLKTNPHLPPGRYIVRLDILDAQTGQRVGRPFLANTITIQDDAPCAQEMPDGLAATQASFGDMLLLRAADIRRQGSSLKVTLYWRSLQRMGLDYKVFVHVFDRASGVPVAQDDAMPRRWSYPTTFWWPGEKVDDKFSISLGSTPPGEYGIAIGVYDPVSGERLPVSILGTDQQFPDGRLVLDQIVKIR